MDAPRIGLLVTREPSVEMYSAGFHAARYGRMWGGDVRGCFHVYGRIWVLVGLFVVELGEVFKVEDKGYRLGVTAEYN